MNFQNEHNFHQKTKKFQKQYFNTSASETNIINQDKKKNQTPTNAALKLFTILKQKNDQNEIITIDL